MNHLDSDKLLEYKLELLDKKESESINDHLSNCQICIEKFNSIENQIELISSYNPVFDTPDLRIPMRNESSSWLKKVAILLIGFIGGYSVSELSQSESTIIVAQKFVSKNSIQDTAIYITCQSDDTFNKF